MDIGNALNVLADADSASERIIAIASLAYSMVFLTAYIVQLCSVIQSLRGVKVEKSSILTIVVFLVSETTLLIVSAVYLLLDAAKGDG